MIFATPNDLRLFANLLENKDNPVFVITPKDHYDYNFCINILAGDFPKSIIEQARETFVLGFRNYFSFENPNRRKIACRYISNKNVRMEVFDLHGNKCLKCGSYEDICLDHIISVANGGEDKIDNLQPLCRSCNSSKGSNNIDYRN